MISNNKSPSLPINFPIVGIGASAGGLDALEAFFSGFSDLPGMAFILVQHFDPTRKCILPELLQQITHMAVCEAIHQMPIQTNSIYVIPPGKSLTLHGNILQVAEPEEPHGQRLPINQLFISLARNLGKQSIGIVLSGMGDDGTEGLRAIKTAGGLGLVQSPETATFDQMPLSAIGENLADVISSPAELASSLYGLTHKNLCGSQRREKHSPLQKIFALTFARTGSDFSQYKKGTVLRRIERRMSIHQLSQMAQYATLLETNPQEIDLLFNEMLIGVTGFFRDKDVWNQLETSFLPELLARFPHGKTLRAWVTGCSTGEEAHTLAIVLTEAIEKLGRSASLPFEIFATDVSQDAIETARRGVFPDAVKETISPQRLENFFVKQAGGYRISKEMRDRLVFAPHNLVSDPPFTKMDVVSCRNVLIYFNAELQKAVMQRFHYSLNPGGLLLLGSAEGISGHENLFSVADGKAHIYRRNSQPANLLQSVSLSPTTLRKVFEMTPVASHGQLQHNFPNLAERLLLERFSAPAVLVSSEGDVIFVNGRTGKYLEPASGKANWNIHAMAKPGLSEALAAGLPSAIRSHKENRILGLKIGTGDEVNTVDMTIVPLTPSASSQAFALIVFEQVCPVDISSVPLLLEGNTDSGIAQLEKLLTGSKEEINTLRYEMLRSREELKSANQELQATNEELQSANEELTTAKEEMQSLNEELQTVNAELQSKLDELSASNNDMKNLLDSTDIATLFLDESLRIRRFTQQATQLYRLISSDIGRPLSDISSDLDYDALLQDASEVLRTLVVSEKRVSTKSRKEFLVRIMPYRTTENVIDGVVITFIQLNVPIGNEGTGRLKLN